MCVCVLVLVLKRCFYLQRDDIVAPPPNFKELFEGEVVVLRLIRIGFGLVWVWFGLVLGSGPGQRIVSLKALRVRVLAKVDV